MSQPNSTKSPDRTQSDAQQEAFDPQQKKPPTKSKSKRTTQSLSKELKQQPEKKDKKKGGKKKEQKPQKSKKDAAPKRKPKSKKQGGGGKDAQQNRAKVSQYMQKQNRPYNLLNVFDNLHGKIKKPELQTILNDLTSEQQLVCKQFGKNKVYFLNQNKFTLNMQQVQQLSSTYTRLKQHQQQLREQNKRLNDEYRRLMARKTLEQMELETFQLSSKIGKLRKKREYLVGGEIVKVDEEEVKQVEKQGDWLERELKKRKRILKECLDSWAEMTEKKVPEVAELMGIELG